MSITAEQQARLRAPFPKEAVGKLPRVTCGNCSRDRQRKHCDRHQRTKCATCHNYISTQHIHLDYVGHAAVTDRLLQVDPEWTWEPMALAADGLPARDPDGGLWIRLTVAGVTRLGYGHADGKTGPDAVKEAIGDAIRNAGMRFGVALDLWHKDGPLPDEDAPTNGHPVGRGEPPDEPPKRTAADARAQLAADAARNGWDLVRIADLFALQHDGRQIAQAENPATIDKFREALYAVSDQDLKAQPASTNGAAS